MKTIFNTFEELENYLINWESFNGGPIYDTVGMLLLLQACIKNLKSNCDIDTFEEMEDVLNPEETVYIKKLIDKISV
ncbi:MAG: hypothetical protein QM535_12045 [Limnohabitans sp.]|nr:hypothetical protein [Limnohabitans sp.]